MKSTLRGIASWGHLHPRTAREPIDLATYLEREARSRVVDNDRLTPEWKRWYDRVRESPKYQPKS